MKHALIAVSFWLAAMATMAQTGFAESNQVFAQFADGRFSDGTYYRSTIMIINSSNSPLTCTLGLNGMSTTLESGESGSTFNIKFLAGPENAMYSRTTTGTQAFQAGYAMLTCDQDVFALVLYAYYSKTGAKLSEATVFPSPQYDLFVMPFDNTEDAKLGVAIVNNRDTPQNFQMTLYLPTGEAVTGKFSVPAKRNLAKFVDEIINVPRNTRAVLQIDSPDAAEFAVIGLRFSGTTFTTIPAF